MAKLEKAPTPAQVDVLVKRYDEAKTAAEAAKTKADELKGELTELVERFGFQHTDKSKRLVGNHHMATTTTATKVNIVDAAVEKFRGFLQGEKLKGLAGHFFVARTTYSLVDAPGEVLKGLQVATPLRNKISGMIAQCFEIKVNNPSLKIETTPA